MGEIGLLNGKATEFDWYYPGKQKQQNQIILSMEKKEVHSISIMIIDVCDIQLEK